ncbi:MAG: hypothetical protein BWZ09_02581 [Alphaproteobacteria bacterium ADurb.BinA305]|nr:MAG: hypothetical protein BWZ09_02581 [Alphaproteobacteria bacterium ADurb.BinA305]
MRQVGRAVGARRAVVDHHHRAHALGEQLAGDDRHRQRAVVRLAAGHRHRVVVEHLVGDVHLRRHRGADGEDARVHVGAVAEVGEHVRGVGERRLADPGHALPAHLAEGLRVLGRQPGRHVVAADAGNRARALRHLGRGVVRAAGTVMRHALDGQARPGERGLLGLDEGEPRLDAVGGVEARDAAGDRARDHRRGELAGGGQQPVGVRQAPLALLVELADHARAHLVLPVIELFLQLVLEELALLLDHEDLVEAVGEAAHALGVERPHHADLVQAQADRRGGGLVDAEVVERLAHVEVALAAGEDAQARLRRVDDHAVQPVLAAVGERGVELVVEQALLLHQRGVGPAQVEAVERQRELLRARDPDVHAEGIDVDRGRGLDRVGQRLERHPAARVARHREAVQAVFQVFLDAGGGEHRHHQRLEHVLGLVRQGRGLGGVVVAGDHQHAAMLRGAGGVGVAEDVAGPVHAGSLAVPDGEHAIDLGVGVEAELLRAPHRGRGEVLVEPGLEADVHRLEEALRLPELLVDAAERRAAVAGDEAGGVQAGGLVAQLLHHRQAYQGLDAGHPGAAGLEGVFIVEGDGGGDVRHGGVNRRRSAGLRVWRGLPAGRRGLLCGWVGAQPRPARPAALVDAHARASGGKDFAQSGLRTPI